jgi:hypothetical protein
MMRHHYSKIFSAGFPSNKSKNAVDIKSTLAHVEKHQGRPVNKEEKCIKEKDTFHLSSVNMLSCCKIRSLGVQQWEILLQNKNTITPKLSHSISMGNQMQGVGAASIEWLRSKVCSTPI